jgi:hypothetical protein
MPFDSLRTIVQYAFQLWEPKTSEQNSLKAGSGLVGNLKSIGTPANLCTPHSTPEIGKLAIITGQ